MKKGCIFVFAILLGVFFLRGCGEEDGEKGYQHPSASKNTAEHYENSSIDLQFDLPDGMQREKTEEYRSEESLAIIKMAGIHEDLFASGTMGYTTVTVFDLAQFEEFQNAFFVEGVKDSIKLGLYSNMTEKDMLEFAFTTIVGTEQNDPWEKTDMQQAIGFAGKEYTCQTWRICNEDGASLYVRGYARRKGDLMISVMIFGQGDSLESALAAMELIEDSYGKTQAA